MRTKITHSYNDLDGVAYLGATSASKSKYQWFKKGTDESSALFYNAKLAKEWMESEKAFGFISDEDSHLWERRKVVETKPLSFAIKSTKLEIEKWMKHIKLLTKNPDITFKGYLTPSGRKDKDVDGLEHRYQHNRYEIINGEWVSLPKPPYLKECRKFLLTEYPWIKMAPQGVEADTIVIYLAEKRGKRAVIGLKDKDLKQVMGSNYIDFNDPVKSLEIVPTTVLGEVHMRQTPSGASLGGSGLKLILAQMVAGDSCDGYKGIHGLGAKFMVTLLEPCKTPKEACKAIVDLYYKKYPDGIMYKDWNNEIQDITTDDLMIQHCQLAYHERGRGDKYNPISRYLAGNNPIFSHTKSGGADHGI